MKGTIILAGAMASLFLAACTTTPATGVAVAPVPATNYGVVTVPPSYVVAPAPAGTAATNAPDLYSRSGTQTQTGVGANTHQKSGD